MTSFTKETAVVQDTAPEKPTEWASRFKATPELWDEAMRFANMLKYCRPHQSRTESRFINDFIRPTGIKFDKKGNMHLTIGDAPILWSCHVDTVHAKKGFQKIEYWTEGVSGDTFLGVGQGEKSSCLGADDTAGIWVILEMIRNKVQGHYIFHRGEECGGIGSRWIAKYNVEALKGIKFAIAFDRKDTSSIITYQGGTRCCSDEFANSLADQLGMGHKCDEGGAFTDTASYVDHIAECTNVSVGYYNAHSSTEKVNIDYLFKLRDAICKIDVSKLVEKRKPGKNTRKTYTYNYRDYDDWGFEGYGYGSYGHKEAKPEGALDFTELTKKFPGPGCGWIGQYYYSNKNGYWVPQEAKKDLGVTKIWSDGKWRKSESSKSWTEDYYKYRGSYDEAVTMIRDNPEIIADMLEFQGYGPLEIKEHIEKSGGKV